MIGGRMGVRGDLRLAIVLGLLLFGVRTTIAVEQQGQATKSAPAAAAPNAASSSALLAWKKQVYTQIAAQSRDYPPSEFAKNEGGIVNLTFSLDRQGRIIDSRIAHSSGFATLDKDALDKLRRAQPFPSPPTEIAVPVRLSLPVRYHPPAVAAWETQVFGKLRENFHYPAVAKANGDHGTVDLMFSVGPQGRLAATRIVRSSGSTTLDKDALDLFRRTQPFPPSPPSGGAQTDIPFRVIYQPCPLLGALLRQCKE
jgi:protein TonB